MYSCVCIDFYFVLFYPAFCSHTCIPKLNQLKNIYILCDQIKFLHSKMLRRMLYIVIWRIKPLPQMYNSTFTVLYFFNSMKSRIIKEQKTV